MLPTPSTASSTSSRGLFPDTGGRSGSQKNVGRHDVECPDEDKEGGPSKSVLGTVRLPGIVWRCGSSLLSRGSIQDTKFFTGVANSDAGARDVGGL